MKNTDMLEIFNSVFRSYAGNGREPIMQFVVDLMEEVGMPPIAVPRYGR